MSIWDQVLSRIEDQVGKHSFSTWFKPTSLLVDGGSSLSIRVPNPLFVEWLPKHYSVVLAEALRDVGRADVKLVFVPDSAAAARDKRPQPPFVPVAFPPPRPSGLTAKPVVTDEPETDEVEDTPVQQRIGGLIPRY